MFYCVSFIWSRLVANEYYFVFQNRGRYVNHVVIQENPVIMQDTDKTVRVECAFTAEDQTVSFRPTAGPDGRQESGSGGISVTWVWTITTFKTVFVLMNQINQSFLDRFDIVKIGIGKPDTQLSITPGQIKTRMF